jgi:chromosome segregation protein
MRLERLEISGFKSFSDRSELSFDQGVTAIVGPNGCGKSNVVDALTWVMGEQSAKSLRGEKMEDVIFNGSDARKPTGTAEVRLRFSGVSASPSLLPRSGGRHTDPDHGNSQSATHGNGNGNGHLIGDIVSAVREVEVTRRLYRSGESEYLIDGHICRLKDIHELLMDTGLGAKAYAIIEQGKIGLILSSRATDRRQLIEEAAGITKYKVRRRAAALKLEAAQQNLTRIDDIVYEVDKQRGSLKRQAVKARRYTRLRDEMRRWERVLFARRYRALGESIETMRRRLGETREQESLAAARLAEVETALTRKRIELVEAESVASRVRDTAHARELEINRRQQQIALDTQQADMLRIRAEELDLERSTLESRREPDRLALEERRRAAAAAERAREDAAGLVAAAAAEQALAQQAIEAAEQDVENARAEVYAVMNTVTALNAALQAATSQRERAQEALTRLQVEAADLQTEQERGVAAQLTAVAALTAAQEALEALRLSRAVREAELATARAELDLRAREVRTREHEVASISARLRSLEELDAHRAGFSDAARMVLVEANGHVGQMGALADFIEVDPRYEKAVEAHLGDLLQHVLVRRHEHAAAGLALVRHEDAGRCGFIVVGGTGATGATGLSAVAPSGAKAGAASGNVPSAVAPIGAEVDAVALSSVVHIEGEHAGAIRAAMGEALIVETFESARDLAMTVPLPVATIDGDVLRGAHLVTGGAKAEARGILATKREIKELRERATAESAALERLTLDTAQIEHAIVHATAAVAALSSEWHQQEKTIVTLEAQLQRAADEQSRLGHRRALVSSETGRVEEEIASLDARQTEARESIGRLDEDKRSGDVLFADAQRRLQDARDASDLLAHRAAEARATHAALVERSSAAAADVSRLEQTARALEQRVETCRADLDVMQQQRERLLAAAVEVQGAMDQDVRVLEDLRTNTREADEQSLALKAATEQEESAIRDARRMLDAVRALAAELDVTRATAEADLSHLATQCLDSVGLPLDDVRAEVERMEAAGEVEPDVNAIRAAEAPELDEDDSATEGQPFRAGDQQQDDSPGENRGDDVVGRQGLSPGLQVGACDDAAPAKMTAEEAIAELRAKIDRLGPVNMMAIEQFSELETRHTFLTTQRQDLIDSIAQTNEAIKRIDETTHARFRDAFTAINANFQQTFSTLFGGGRAGLTLLDESDPLESGIDIVASPPGKRLQNVMLLSGGEKALTAIALMFAIFKYKPSPFCLLDEIDAPLDDANIGRFVEMLRGMLDRTQFIIITHNRKTMEIANRLYGVTMEEPGVSKLISIQLN